MAPTTARYVSPTGEERTPCVTTSEPSLLALVAFNVMSVIAPFLPEATAPWMAKSTISFTWMAVPAVALISLFTIAPMSEMSAAFVAPRAIKPR